MRIHIPLVRSLLREAARVMPSVLLGIAVLMLSVTISCPDAMAQTGVVPVGANTNWTTDLMLYNPSNAAVKQSVGHLTFTHPPFDPIVQTATVTIAPGQTLRIPRFDKYYDGGLYILDVDPALRASAYLTFGGGSAKFECTKLTAGLSAATPTLNFRMIVTDFAPNAIGAYPTFLSKNDVTVKVVLRVFNGDASSYTDESVDVPPGISQVPIRTYLPSGGNVSMCLISCSVGVPITLAGPIYPFIVLGDGGTQVVRYPEP